MVIFFILRYVPYLAVVECQREKRYLTSSEILKGEKDHNKKTGQTKSESENKIRARKRGRGGGGH